jgi:hypothetical protein
MIVGVAVAVVSVVVVAMVVMVVMAVMVVVFLVVVGTRRLVLRTDVQIRGAGDLGGITRSRQRSRVVIG